LCGAQESRGDKFADGIDIKDVNAYNLRRPEILGLRKLSTHLSKGGEKN